MDFDVGHSDLVAEDEDLLASAHRGRVIADVRDDGVGVGPLVLDDVGHHRLQLLVPLLRLQRHLHVNVQLVI